MRPTTNDQPAELNGLTRSLDFRFETTLRRTDKTLLASGSLEGQPVVVKLLLDPDPFWAAKWRHEIGVYRVFVRHHPPVRVPALLHTDGTRLLILERLPGQPVDADRYPTRPVADRAIGAALDALRALAGWHPPAGVFTPTFDYSDRIRRYHAHGLLDNADRTALTALLGDRGDRWQVNHGDPLPSNLLLDGDTCALLDWEFTGLFLPGFDLAMLHTLLVRTPAARARIEAAVAADGIAVPFVVNLAMVLTRELRRHHELPPDAPHRTRLAFLEPAWQEARHRIHTLATGGA
jgi:hypothetical protein